MVARTNGRVFVEMRSSGRQVLVGVLHPGITPFWVHFPDTAIYTEEHV